MAMISATVIQDTPRKPDKSGSHQEPMRPLATLLIFVVSTDCTRRRRLRRGRATGRVLPRQNGPFWGEADRPHLASAGESLQPLDGLGALRELCDQRHADVTAAR